MDCESTASVSWLDVLAAALRERPATPADLAAVLGVADAALHGPLEQLAEMRLLNVIGDELVYRRPDFAAADALQHTLDEGVRSLQESVQRSKELIADLPELLSSWTNGRESPSLPLDVIEGPWALADMWRLQSSRNAPRSADLCIPATGVLRAAGLEYAETFWAARAGDEHRVRVILSDEDARAPENQWHIDNELATGTLIRVHPRPPSFFWIIDDDIVALPQIWGDPDPTTVVGARTSALATVLHWAFESLWTQSRPVRTDEHAWDPMLRLLSRGMTVEAAAQTLGLSPRTGRRRIDEAMRYFGASSQFTLGAAWTARSGPDTGSRA